MEVMGMISDGTKKNMRLLSQYGGGRDINQVDAPLLHEMGSIGLIKNGMSIKRGKITVKTTPVGNGFSGNWFTRRA
jgi:hypothetical protein